MKPGNNVYKKENPHQYHLLVGVSNSGLSVTSFGGKIGVRLHLPHSQGFLHPQRKGKINTGQRLTSTDGLKKHKRKV